MSIEKQVEENTGFLDNIKIKEREILEYLPIAKGLETVSLEVTEQEKQWILDKRNIQKAAEEEGRSEIFSFLDVEPVNKAITVKVPIPGDPDDKRKSINVDLVYDPVEGNYLKKITSRSKILARDLLFISKNFDEITENL